MGTPEARQLLPGLWHIRDTCNVYIVVRGGAAVAIDFGSGRWLDDLPRLGVGRLERVFLTHHHADQLFGLSALPDRSFSVHAPEGEERFLDPAQLGPGGFDIRQRGCPDSYRVLPTGITHVDYGTIRGFSDFLWRRQRIRFLHTPGHGPAACSVIMDHRGRQIVFCGDAAHSGGTVWEPFNLEWDHWTGTGALAAWEGVERLAGIGVSILCPSHGPVIDRAPRSALRALSRRLLAFYRAKGQIAPGEPDRYLPLQRVRPGARRVLPHLWQFGANGYLLLSEQGSALVVDPTIPDLPALEELLSGLGGGVSLDACTVSHYHHDHSDGIPQLRQRHGTRCLLHPWVAEPLEAQDTAAPWLPREPIRADELLPESGQWRWNEYEIRVESWPGQTRWHCLLMTRIDGRRVAFAGDSFQPPSRWNGTGGFCAYNRSRFADGFASSARLIREWKPELLAAGHATVCRFRDARFRKIEAWAMRAQRAVAALCPTGDPERDYHVPFHAIAAAAGGELGARATLDAADPAAAGQLYWKA